MRKVMPILRGQAGALRLPALAFVALLLASQLVATVAEAALPNPTVTGPIATTAPNGDPSRNYVFLATILFPPGSGYIEQEFFMSGTARRFSTTCTSSGCSAAGALNLATVVDSGHPYKIRLVVRRPSDATKFNGKVIVEWQNVTNNWELDVQWYRAAEYFIRKGYAYVGVGPQRAGIHGSPNGLRLWNPARYGTLDATVNGAITNDALKFDIFAQAGQAIKNPSGIDPLGNLSKSSRKLIATGDSQSSGNLAPYLAAVHPLDPIYDGFVLGGPLGSPIPDNATAKVLKVISEWDLTSSEARVRQPDSATRVSWEVAGSSHSDYHNFVVNSPVRFRDVGIVGILPDTTNCVAPARSRTNLYLVYHAAYDWMARWIDSNQVPPSMKAPIETTQSGTTFTIVRDGFGLSNSGGVRIPDVTVPIALNNGANLGGKGTTSAGACAQAGTWIPFTAAQLNSLYMSHDDYVLRVREAATRSVNEGFILQDDFDTLVKLADASDVLRTPYPDGTVRVAEYYRVLSNQYFWTADIAERASLEAGGSNGDWFATGAAFRAWPAAATSPTDALPVCRFFGTAIGPTSHFFTLSATECASLKSSPFWTYEGTAFKAHPVNVFGCADNHDTVIRLWKPGATTPASRHRYVIGSSALASALDAGYVLEGAVFCTPK